MPRVASIEKRGLGWRVVWRFNRSKEYTCPFPSEEQAEQARALAQAHRHNVSAAEVERIVLGLPEPAADSARASLGLKELCDQHLEAKTRITPGTRGGYKRMLAKRVYPALGAMTPIADVNPMDIGRWLNGMRAEGLSNSTLTNHYNILHGAYAAAVAAGLVESNPCADSDFVRQQVADDDTGDEQRVYLTHVEFGILRRAFRPADRLFIDYLAGTGARWSEATANKIRDVQPLGRWDLLRSEWAPRCGPRVQIARAWKKNENGGGTYLGTTKGRRKRTLDIDDELHAAVTYLSAGRDDDDFLFTSAQGHPLNYANYFRRVWKPAVIRARRCLIHPPPNDGVPAVGAARGRCRDFGGTRTNGHPCDAGVLPGLSRCRSHAGPRPDAVSTCDCLDVLHVAPTPHDLRHTHVAWLFADPNVSPSAVSQRVGHANLMTTDLVYGGLMPSAEMAAARAITSALKAARSG